MEINSSGEETVIKVRKPYTITKQRERWTEAEHKRFLEALKLYGRAWQRIEEHVGTKTAVQIRSHAQKFFTKLEKEAINNGTSPGQAHDIDIPPPRPKRKPNCPYPRKGCLSSETPTREVPKSSVSLSNSNAEMASNGTLQLTCIRKLQRKELSENGSCSEVINIFREAPSASFSSSNKSSSNHGVSGGIEPTKTENKDIATMERKSTSIDVGKDVKDINDQEMERNNRVHISSNYDGSHEDCLDNSMKHMQLKPNTVETTYTGQHAASAPLYQMNKTGATGAPDPGTEGSHPDQTSDRVGGANGSMDCIHPTLPVDPKIGSSSTAQSFPHNYAGFAPTMQCHCNQDAYRSSLNMSSTFSNMLVSTLLSNPTVHAAARLAASYWTLKKILEYTYTGFVMVGDDIVKPVRTLAKYCHLKSLAEMLQKEQPRWNSNYARYDLTVALGAVEHSFSDIILEAQSNEEMKCDHGLCQLSTPHVHSHKIVLIMSCDYLRALFRSGMHESFSDVIRVPLGWQALDKLVHWFYSGELPKAALDCRWNNLSSDEQGSHLNAYAELSSLAEFWFLEGVKEESLSAVSALLGSSTSAAAAVEFVAFAASLGQWEMVEAGVRSVAHLYPRLRDSGRLERLDDELLDMVRTEYVRYSQHGGGQR